tara:strand:+ start:347 stop:628 length:282 start_codon:yes stop_codon:yes gene_type:complete
MVSKKLTRARRKIDSIDRDIFKLIKKRSIIVKHMMYLKKNKNEIVDHIRIKEILKNIRKKSIQNKIDPKVTNKIWKSMIWSYVDYQRRNFKKK